ncbi:cytochrome p450 domain-containing protein [Ditylenchus destructor]|nr:cytochrome p450 domain-containing protein [Ditylenchus destructor]
MLLLIFILAFTFLLIYNNVWKRINLPPGPAPLPLLGNRLAFVRKAPGYDPLIAWSKKYGPVFTFWLSETPIVAVTDYEIIKETFLKDGESYVGRDFFNELFATMHKVTHGIHGVARTEGEEWLQLRRFSLKLLRNLGVGKNQVEQKIITEIKTLVETIESDLEKQKSEVENDDGYNLIPLIDVAVGSIINQIAFGYRFIGETRKEFYEMKAIIAAQVQSFVHPVASAVMMMPTLRYFPIFSYYYRDVESRFTRLYEFFDRQIDTTIKRREKEIKEGYTPDDEDTYFVDAFLKEIEERKTDDPYFNIDSLRGLCQDLFIAGQETSANTLKFLILYMIRFPEVQSKMQEELDNVAADDEDGNRHIGLIDRAKLPYTNAVINETQRFCNLLPINLIHKTTRDVQIAGYKIPEGTRITPMISCVLYDKKIFPKPNEFIPERFLENGQLKKCEELIPFSIGKRQCMGESLARMELFLFTANIFYKFKISAVDERHPPTLEKRPGFTVGPIDYKCRIEQRKSKIFD